LEDKSQAQGNPKEHFMVELRENDRVGVNPLGGHRHSENRQNATNEGNVLTGR